MFLVENNINKDMDLLDHKNYPTPKQEYKVLVRCSTFNQSRYIEDALNGFAMQKTDFPFVCFVMDDASTDGEQEVIKKWMKCECDMGKAETIDSPTSIIIIAPHKTNLSCTFAFYLLKQNLYGTGKKIHYLNPWREKCEYEAICEGDDYWINPTKLQKQVDFLENNPSCGMVHSKCMMYEQNKQKFSHIILGEEFSSFNELLLSNKIITNSILLRTNLYLKYYNESKKWDKSSWLMGDYPLWLYISYNSNIVLLNEIVGVYRVLCNSASHSTNINKLLAFNKSVYDIQLFFANKYEVEDHIIEKISTNFHNNECLLLIKNKDFLKFIRKIVKIPSNKIISVFSFIFNRIYNHCLLKLKLEK